MLSLFTKLYYYRQRENRHNKENFLTEILTFCLREDEKFRTALCQHLGLPDRPDKLWADPQVSYEGLGCPDVELLWDQAHLLIECKIESAEGQDQIGRYCNILAQSDRPQQHLVYLTKYYEEKKPPEKVHFHSLRWYEIYSMINIDMHPITQQLKAYLKDESMDNKSEFLISDLMALQSISGVIAKMDAVLDQAKNYFHAHEKIDLGKLSNADSRTSALRNHGSYRDGLTITGADGYSFSLSQGFSWTAGNEVSLYLNFWLPKDRYAQKDQQYLGVFQKVWYDATVETYKGSPVIGFARLASDFINESNQIPAMVRQLRSWIDQVSTLQLAYPEKFGITNGK